MVPAIDGALDRAATSISAARPMTGGIESASVLRIPKSPPCCSSLKPLSQWLSAPVTMWPGPSICVPRLSEMNRAQLYGTPAPADD